MMINDVAQHHAKPMVKTSCLMSLVPAWSHLDCAALCASHWGSTSQHHVPRWAARTAIDPGTSQELKASKRSIVCKWRKASWAVSHRLLWMFTYPCFWIGCDPRPRFWTKMLGSPSFINCNMRYEADWAATNWHLRFISHRERSKPCHLASWKVKPWLISYWLV